MSKKKDKRIKSSEPNSVAIEKALYNYKDNSCWKDVIPFLLKWIEDNQPDDTAYTIEFFGYKKRK